MTSALTLPYQLQSVKPSDETLSAPMSGQFKSSPFYVAIGSLPISGLTAIALTAICYAILPEAAAKELAPQLQLFTLGTGALGSSGGVLGMVKRGLDITDGKKQLELLKAASLYPQAPRTVNAGGDINVSTTAQPSDEIPILGTREFVDENNNGIDDNDEYGPQDDEA